jgi:hypothetical protein
MKKYILGAIVGIALLFFLAWSTENGKLLLSGANFIGVAEFTDPDVPADQLEIYADSATGYITPQSIGDIVINVNGDDTNLTVEGDTDANLLTIDAGLEYIGIGKAAPEKKLEVGGDVLIANNDAAGQPSWKLYFRSDNGGTEQTSSLYNVNGADPYLRMSVPNDAGAETAILDFHDTVVAVVTDDSVDFGATGANRIKDIYLSGDVNAEAGSVVANVDLTATTGDVSVGDDVLLADGAVVGITGNEVITFNAAGSINFSGASVDVDGAFTCSTIVADTTVAATTTVSDSVGNVRILEKVQNDAPSEPADCVAGNEGTVIYVDDTNDNGFAKLCFCAYDDNPGTYEWQDVDDPTTACF